MSHFAMNHYKSNLPLHICILLTPSPLDIPCLLVNVLQSAPWTRTGGRGVLGQLVLTSRHAVVCAHAGETLKYDDAGRWVEVTSSDRLKLTKTEGQVWITLYHLLMDPQCQQKYEFNQYNKGHILKVFHIC